MDAIAALEDLRGALRSVLLPLGTPGAARGRDACERALRRLDDFVLPRASSLDAPLLAVVGGIHGIGQVDPRQRPGGSAGLRLLAAPSDDAPPRPPAQGR